MTKVDMEDIKKENTEETSEDPERRTEGRDFQEFR